MTMMTITALTMIKDDINNDNDDDHDDDLIEPQKDDFQHAKTQVTRKPEMAHGEFHCNAVTMTGDKSPSRGQW